MLVYFATYSRACKYWRSRVMYPSETKLADRRKDSTTFEYVVVEGEECADGKGHHEGREQDESLDHGPVFLCRQT